MAYYFDGIKCDTLAELDALRARKSGHAPAKTVEVKPIKLTDEQALKIALGGEPKPPLSLEYLEIFYNTTMNAIIKKIYGAMLQPKIKCGMQSRVVSVIPMRATATSQTNQ